MHAVMGLKIGIWSINNSHCMPISLFAVMPSMGHWVSDTGLMTSKDLSETVHG